MTALATPRRPGARSILMIATSISASVAIALAMDAVLIRFSADVPAVILAGAVLFNGTGIMQSLVGGIIEWRRPGHAIGRLMLLAGPLYAIAAAGWTTADRLRPLIDPAHYQWFSWAVAVLISYPAVALIAGWIPLLFPTGKLPSPRWRAPAALLLALTGVGLIASTLRPGPIATGGADLVNPIGIESWPGFLQPFVDAVPFLVLATLLLAVVALVTRYRRGDRTERLQIRWFVAAVVIVPISLVGILFELALRAGGLFGGAVGPGSGGPNSLVSGLAAYAGIFAMPVAIGIAVTRYRLYEVDRLISRTIGWTLVTGVLVAVFAGTVVGLQAIFAQVTQGQTLAVAASTLIAFALFQPVRRRVQSAVNRRFDRARYDGDRTAAAFAERLRDRVDLAGLESDIAGVVDTALRPSRIGIWIRRPGPGGPA